MKKLRSATDTMKEVAAIYAALLLVSASLFMLVEGHSFSASLYWAGTTATSTGYGDISPKTGIGQVIAFVLMHLSVLVVMPLIIVRLIDRMNENRDAFTHEEQVHILEGLARIERRLDSLEQTGARNAGSGEAEAPELGGPRPA